MPFPLLFFAATTSDLLPLLVGVRLYRALPRVARILLIFFALTVVLDAISLALAFRKTNNHWVSHLFTLIEFGFLSYVFSCWQVNRRIRLAMRITIVLFSALWFASKLGLEDIGSFDNVTLPLAGLVLTCYALLTLVSLVIEETSSVVGEFRFWVSCGVLIYHAGTLLASAFSSTVLIWEVPNALNIVANLCYVGGLLSLHRTHSGGQLS